MRFLSKAVRAFSFFSIGLSLLMPRGSSALPEPGTPAPALEFTQLLQAPAGTKVDWAALRGKVVVLEFWATWCAPCVAAIPHWNELASSVDPSRFAFISIDDEDPAKVEKFLEKKKLAGWSGIDTTGEVFKRYGVEGRPTTIIVDGEGRIAAVTRPEILNAEALSALASGKKVIFPPVPEIPAAAMFQFATPAMPQIGQKDSGNAIFEISLSKVSPANGITIGSGPHYKDIHGVDAAWLLRIIYDTQSDRIVVHGSLPEDHYGMHARFTGMDSASEDAMMQAAVAAGLRLDIKKKKVIRNVYLMQATPAAQQLIVPTVSQKSTRMANQGRIQLVNVEPDELSKSLESWLNIPVIDETGVKTHFDADFSFPSSDLKSINELLGKALGLRLSEAVREVEVFEVTPLPEAKPSEAAAVEAKH